MSRSQPPQWNLSGEWTPTCRTLQGFSTPWASLPRLAVAEPKLGAHVAFRLQELNSALSNTRQHLSLQISTAPLLTHTWAACKFNLPLFRCIYELSTERQRGASFILMAWDSTVSIVYPLVLKNVCWGCSTAALHLCLLLPIPALPQLSLVMAPASWKGHGIAQWHCSYHSSVWWP